MFSLYHTNIESQVLYFVEANKHKYCHL